MRCQHQIHPRLDLVFFSITKQNAGQIVILRIDQDLILNEGVFQFPQIRFIFDPKFNFTGFFRQFFAAHIRQIDDPHLDDLPRDANRAIDSCQIGFRLSGTNGISDHILTALDIFEVDHAGQANTMQGDDVNSIACKTQFNQ